MAKKDIITIFLGSEQKLNVNIKPVAGFTADDFDFVVDVYCSPKRTSTKSKNELIRVDEENYVFKLDTNEVGEVPPLQNSAFNSAAVIVVPDALYDNWIISTNWSAYADQIIKKTDWDAQ